MTNSVRVAVVGGTGYTAKELMHWILRHPAAKLTCVTSESAAGKPVISVHTDFRKQLPDQFCFEKLDAKKIAQKADIVFLCLPHAESARRAAQFLAQGLRVIDLSADFRLTSPAVYKEWYGQTHPHPELLKKAVYGLPEIYRDKISCASLIANPGCYATASILSALPLVSAGLTRSIIIDAKSGVSGAGRKLDSRYLFGETHENFLPYAVDRHRHAPEIAQVLSANARAKKKITVTFVPHLLPVMRGILVTVYAQLDQKLDPRKLWDRYATFYEVSPFVVVLPQGQFPELKHVQNSNFCQIGVQLARDNRSAIIVAAIDNLAKGASTQAIQNMNLMLGWDETTGLA